MKTGIEQISQERTEQIEKHGYTIAGDVRHNSSNQLVEAIMLLVSSVAFERGGLTDLPDEAFEELMPDTWERKTCLKMVKKSDEEKLKLIGAFAAAELDRLNAIK